MSVQTLTDRKLLQAMISMNLKTSLRVLLHFTFYITSLVQALILDIISNIMLFFTNHSVMINALMAGDHWWKVCPLNSFLPVNICNKACIETKYKVYKSNYPVHPISTHFLLPFYIYIKLKKQNKILIIIYIQK